MSKKRKNHHRACLALKSPFTHEALEKWLLEIPRKSKIRIVTVTPLGLKEGPAVTYLEAVFWKRNPIPKKQN